MRFSFLDLSFLLIYQSLAISDFFIHVNQRFAFRAVVKPFGSTCGLSTGSGDGDTIALNAR